MEGGEDGSMLRPAGGVVVARDESDSQNDEKAGTSTT